MPTTPDPLRIAVVADQHLTRVGLRMTLEAHADFRVVAESDRGQEDVPTATQVDVVVVDTLEPCTDTQTLTCALKRLRPQAAVLVVTNRLCACAHRVLAAGASGILLKSARPEQLAGAIRSVAAGYAVVPAPMVGELRSGPAGRPRPSNGPTAVEERAAQARLASLTSRERDVLTCLASGASNGEAARQLHLSEGTVKSHVQRLLQKLGVRDRVQAVVFAYRSGFASADEQPEPTPQLLRVLTAG